MRVSYGLEWDVSSTEDSPLPSFRTAVSHQSFDSSQPRKGQISNGWTAMHALLCIIARYQAQTLYRHHMSSCTSQTFQNVRQIRHVNHKAHWAKTQQSATKTVILLTSSGSCDLQIHISAECNGDIEQCFVSAPRVHASSPRQQGRSEGDHRLQIWRYADDLAEIKDVWRAI